MEESASLICCSCTWGWPRVRLCFRPKLLHSAVDNRQRPTHTDRLTWGTPPRWPPPLGRAELPGLSLLWHTERSTTLLQTLIVYILGFLTHDCVQIQCARPKINKQNLIRDGRFREGTYCRLKPQFTEKLLLKSFVLSAKLKSAGDFEEL